MRALELQRRPAEMEPTDPLDRLRQQGQLTEDDRIAENYLHWELGTLVGLHRMPWIRFLWIKGGRRIRKTDFLIKRLIQKCLRRPPGTDVGYINRSFKQAKATAWKRFKRKFTYPNNWLLEGVPNENGLSIPLIGNRTIYLLGSEDPDSLRGYELSDVGVDEASVNQDLPTLMSEVVEPMVSDKNGTVDFAFTSRGRGYHYQQHQIGDAKNPHRDEAYWSITVPQSKVGTVPQAEMERSLRQNGPDIHGQEYECVDLDYVGLAVHQFVRHEAPEGNILPRLWYAGLKPFLTYFGVIDYARSSGSTVREVWAADRFGRAIFVEEMVLPGGTPERLARQIRQQDERLGVNVLVNVAGRDCWHKESSGKAMADQLTARQIPCVRCNFSLVDAVTELNQRCKDIQEADYDPVGEGLPMFLIVEGECPKLQLQLCMVEYADLEKKSQHLKDALDCARMAVMQNYRAVPGKRLPEGGIHQSRIQQLLALQAGDRSGGRRRHPRSGRPL